MTDSTSGRTTSPLPSASDSVADLFAEYGRFKPRPTYLIVSPRVARMIEEQIGPMPGVELIVSEYLPDESTAWHYTPSAGLGDPMMP
jgi:hypothetical protein